MTKKKLKNYRHLLREIAKTEKEIERLLARQAKLPEVKDKVQASLEEFPYIRTYVTVDAKDPLANSTIEKLLAKKRALLLRLQKERLEIEDFVQSLEDSMARQVFDAVYIDGKSQLQTAQDLSVDQSTISRIINKNLKDA